MAKKRSSTPTKVESLRHKDTRKNIPTEELRDVSERTIAKVEAEAEQVEKLRRPYNEVYRLYEALCEVVDPDSLGDWFAMPNKSLGGLKPIEVIERGEIDRLWDLAYRLRSGMPG